MCIEVLDRPAKWGDTWKLTTSEIPQEDFCHKRKSHGIKDVPESKESIVGNTDSKVVINLMDAKSRWYLCHYTQTRRSLAKFPQKQKNVQENSFGFVALCLIINPCDKLTPPAHSLLDLTQLLRGSKLGLGREVFVVHGAVPCQ